jgi:tRNA pseudouridine55 synthase
MSKINCDQPINGILLLNKPQGLSSHTALKKVQYLLRAKKAGHTGSLDPLATGMLPLCFGEATKFCQYLLDEDKCYQATGLLGIKTSTADALGEVIASLDSFHITKERLIEVLQQFTGLIEQVPSMYSALKYKGVPLYKLARQGMQIERTARSIQVHQIKLLNFDGEKFTIEVNCSKGTYIRNLVEDIGEQLGTYAHVTQLHRKYTASFSKEPMYSLEELSSQDPADLLHHCLLPIERAVDYMPQISVSENQMIQLRQGKIIDLSPSHGLELSSSRDLTAGSKDLTTAIDPAFKSQNVLVRIHNSASQFLGLGELNPLGSLKVKRLLAQ